MSRPCSFCSRRRACVPGADACLRCLQALQDEAARPGPPGRRTPPAPPPAPPSRLVVLPGAGRSPEELRAAGLPYLARQAARRARRSS